MRIAVIGVGLIGGSVGLAARERIEGAEVVGYDLVPAVLDLAIERGALDSGAGSVAEALGGAGEDTVVTDVGSTKRAVADAGKDPRFVGGHPLAGAESAGVENARA